MGVGEQFELEKTGRIDPEQTDDAEQADALDANPCVHDWEHHPCKPGGFILCSRCGKRK